MTCHYGYYVYHLFVLFFYKPSVFGQREYRMLDCYFLFCLSLYSDLGY